MSTGPVRPSPTPPVASHDQVPQQGSPHSARGALGATKEHPRTFAEVLSRTKQAGALATGPAGTVVAGAGNRESIRAREVSDQSSAVRVLAERALDADKRVDALLASAGRGRSFSAGELIALQATVFRYSQTVEVISRAADRLVGAIKQTMGTQV